MKNLVLVIFLVAITVFSVIGQDFRNATWGMSPSEVKVSEDSKLEEETKDVIIYKTTLAGHEALVGYIFFEGKLVRAKYVLTEEYINKNEHVSDYDMLNSYLKKKYGEPVEEEIDWQTDSWRKEDKSNWGNAVSQGEVILYTSYKTSNTEITVLLYAEDYRVINEIEYSSMDAELKSLEEEKILKDF